MVRNVKMYLILGILSSLSRFTSSGFQVIHFTKCEDSTSTLFPYRKERNGGIRAKPEESPEIKEEAAEFFASGRVADEGEALRGR